MFKAATVMVIACEQALLALASTKITYTNYTPPSAYKQTMVTAIKGKLKDETGEMDRMQYALYEDTQTWEAWKAWAEIEGIKTDRIKNFSPRALHLRGNWATIPDDGKAKSFMCISDKTVDSVTTPNLGAICMEAQVVSSVYSTVTWRMTYAQANTKLKDAVTVANSSANLVL